MSTHNDDGPAFPQIESEWDQDEHKYTGRIYSEGGASLRDYFAAKALAGILGRSNSTPGVHRKEPEGFAAFAYECADAMLKARKQSQEAL